mgnify:FL=1
MKDDLEIIKQIYKDADMSITSLTTLLTDLEDKDNKIKGTIKNIKEGYQRYKDMAQKILKKEKVELENNSFMTKMMANMGIKKEVKSDNSDASIADMLIKGILMGETDIDKKLKSFEKVDKKIEKIATDFKEFQEDNIKALKEHL